MNDEPQFERREQFNGPYPTDDEWNFGETFDVPPAGRGAQWKSAAIMFAVAALFFFLLWRLAR